MRGSSHKQNFVVYFGPCLSDILVPLGLGLGLPVYHICNCLFIYPFTHLFTYLFVYVFVALFVYLLFVYLSLTFPSSFSPGSSFHFIQYP